MCDGLPELLSRPKSRVGHADMKAGREEVEGVEMILEGLGPGTIRVPVTAVSTAGAGRPEEALGRDVPDEDAAAELEELRKKHPREGGDVLWEQV